MDIDRDRQSALHFTTEQLSHPETLDPELLYQALSSRGLAIDCSSAHSHLALVKLFVDHLAPKPQRKRKSHRDR